MLLKQDIERLDGVKAFIDSHMSRDLCIRNLSKRFHISPTTLRRQFYQQFNITIFRYIFNSRMEYARELILEFNFSIAEVSHRVGYSEPSNFTHAFIRYHGFPPSKLYLI